MIIRSAAPHAIAGLGPAGGGAAKRMSAIVAVVFDIGGVVQDSPLHAIARYERDHGIAPNAINRAVVAAGEGGAWARLERGELTVAAFCAPFEADCRAHGVGVDGAALMARIAEAGVARPRMLEAIRRIRALDLLGRVAEGAEDPVVEAGRRRLLREVRAHVLPHHVALACHLENPAVAALADQRVAVREPLRTRDVRAEELEERLVGVLPHDG